jgi:quercetin dioxygenase-like cupin family protein
MAHGIRRVVTGHDAQGKAIVASDTVIAPEKVPNGDALFAKLWTTATSPASCDDPTDGASRASGLTLPGGTVLRFVEMQPFARSPMHRTSSVDYGIVLDGEVDLELDDGKRVHLTPGDVVVQRGTIHVWVNETARPARIAFILIDATPATVAGRALPDVSGRE